MKKQILIIIVSLVALISCKKDEQWIPDIFSFISKEMEVLVNEDTEYFILKGKMYGKLKRGDRVSKIRVLNERTTAIKGTHYELTDTLMHFPTNTEESEIKVKLIRGSITSPLDLTLYHVFYDTEKDMSAHIDTITVKLIPMK